MLRILQSIFSKGPTSGKYPESLVKAAIERAVDGTDPWIRAVSGYKRLLRPAIVQSIDYVVSLIDSIVPPIEINSDSYDNDSQLRSYFISHADMRRALFSDQNIANIRRVRELAPSRQVVALLVMEKQEKIIYGSELSGSIVLHDVPLMSISFENYRLIDLSISENEVRHQLKRRAFDHLLSIALRQIIAVKAERNKLERYRTLLQSKLNLLRSGGWGFNNNPGEPIDVQGIEALLAQIESDLLGLGGDDSMLENYLNVVVDVLSHPAEHIWLKREVLIRDHMGIKRREVIDGAEKTTLQVISNDEGRSLVISLIEISDEQ